MKYKCLIHPDEHLSIRYDHLINGVGCPKCHYESISGENSYLWKGGITDLSHYLRCKLDKWKRDSLEKYNYTCFVTGQRGVELEIHHVKAFNVIRDEILLELNMPIYQTIGEYHPEQIEKITQRFLEEHEIHEGIPLTTEAHNLFHSIYGFDETVTMRDLLDFKQRYQNGEFKN